MSLEDDKISELPDVLLHHILSFLPTKCSVSTSILSKRWRYLWTSVSILDFRECRSLSGDLENEDNESKRFMNFVDNVLTLHDKANLHKFYLNCNEHFDASRVTAWISTVISHKVEKLILSIDPQISFLFPPNLFTCESLTMLEIEMASTLNLPNSISFPRLKILRLMYIRFTDENLTKQFFSNCPVLEELVLTRCTWIDMDAVSISAPALKCLTISNPMPFGLDRLGKCEVEICAPSLRSLTYDEHVARDYVLHNLTSLVDANIDFIMPANPLGEEIVEPIRNNITRKFFGGISNVKFLKMSGETFKVLFLVDNLLTNQPTFYNLIHLEVTSKFPRTTKRTLLDLLQLSPNLESLVFAEGFDLRRSNNDNVWTLDLVPQCLLLHLKTVEIREFRGLPWELNMVKLLLENARVLKSMIIKSFLSENKKNEVMEQLRMFPKGSTSCAVKLLLKRKKKAPACQKCGVKGFVELLIYCNSCRVSAEHSYCLDKLPKNDGKKVIWSCVKCAQ